MNGSDRNFFFVSTKLIFEIISIFTTMNNNNNNNKIDLFSCFCGFKNETIVLWSWKQSWKSIFHKIDYRYIDRC